MNRDLLAETLNGRILVEVKPLSGKLQRKGVPGVEKLTLPSKVANVAVKGKQMVIQLENGDGILSTLGMSGWWYPHDRRVTEAMREGNAYMNGKIVKVGDVVEQAYKFSRVELITEEGPTAVFCDMRNFGNMTCLTAEQLKTAHPHNKLGVDLLNEAPNIGNWSMKWLAKKALATKGQLRKKIGELLLDQEFACGLGNIYRAEVLYASGINPTKTLADLSTAEWTRIGQTAPFILSMAYATQGVMDYPGWFLQSFLGFNVAEDTSYKRHLVYGRKTDPRGRAVKAETIGGRTMWYCPEAQL